MDKGTNLSRLIPVAQPVLNGNEKIYVNDCLDSNWISSNGKYIVSFEEAFAAFCTAKHAVSCCNGTVALHMALLALGIGPGDEVIVPTLTFVATANAVIYCGAKPVFIDAEATTWNIDAGQIEEYVTTRTRAIIAVHLYGHPADMDTIFTIANKYDLFVIEDAAEAHGATYKGKVVGSIGHVATFSFYGNKIITSGEGGMVVTSNKQTYDKLLKLRGQGMDPGKRYWFPELGYNYRMTNICAAIGFAQLENIHWHLAKRREIAAQYQSRLDSINGLSRQQELPYVKHVFWMNSIIINNFIEVERDHVITELTGCGIETRPVFYPMHSLPFYKPNIEQRQFPVADRIASRGINLPSHAALTINEIDYICDSLNEILR